jgi:formate dehydrogenase subunit gamma
MQSESPPDRADERPESTVVRFTLTQRIEHVLLILSFTMLVLTGLPQKFAAAGWAQSMIWAFGGIDATRFIHRAVAILFVIEGAFHLGNVAWALVTRRARPTMLPTPHDVSDFFRQIGYYLGLAKTEPAYDRYDYRQKFEYWGVVWGGVVMVATGLVMAFPTRAAAIFPGEFIPAAKEAHGGEALLAFLVIVTWHLYGAHFNPHRFPADTTIFTGRISRHRMEVEHPLELARMEESARRDPDPT